MSDPWPSSSAATGEAHADEHPPAAEAAVPAQIRSGVAQASGVLLGRRRGERMRRRGGGGGGFGDRPSRLRVATLVAFFDFEAVDHEDSEAH